MVEHEVLAKAEISAEKREVPNATQITPMVAQLPNALGVVSTSTVTPKVVTLDTPKTIQQPLILVTLGAPTPELQKIIDVSSKAAPK